MKQKISALLALNRVQSRLELVAVKNLDPVEASNMAEQISAASELAKLRPGLNWRRNEDR